MGDAEEAKFRKSGRLAGYLVLGATALGVLVIASQALNKLNSSPPKPAPYELSQTKPDPAPSPPFKTLDGSLSLRGISLGITYDEFRALQMPGEPDRKRVRPDCFPERQSGDRICLVASDPIETFGETRHLFSIGAGRGDVQFIFTRGVDAKSRLVAISFGAENDQIDGVLLELKALYGTPEATLGSAETGLGIQVDKERLEWRFTDQTIVLETRCERVNRFCVRFTDLSAGRLRAERDRRALTPAQ